MCLVIEEEGMTSSTLIIRSLDNVDTGMLGTKTTLSCSLIMHGKSSNLRRKSIEYFLCKDNFPFTDTALTF